MDHDEQVSKAEIPPASAAARASVVKELKGYGVVRGILVQIARDGQILEVRCEMPQCYCPRGRGKFEQRAPGAKWQPTADHYPKLKMHKGHLTPDNVRLAHRFCNQRDYLWRKKINGMLRNKLSLHRFVPWIGGTF